MSPVSTPDVNDAGAWGEAKKIPKRRGLSPHLIRRRSESPALAVATLEILVSPIGLGHAVRLTTLEVARANRDCQSEDVTFDTTVPSSVQSSRIRSRWN